MPPKNGKLERLQIIRDYIGVMQPLDEARQLRLIKNKMTFRNGEPFAYVNQPIVYAKDDVDKTYKKKVRQQARESPNSSVLPKVETDQRGLHRERLNSNTDYEFIPITRAGPRENEVVPQELPAFRITLPQIERPERSD